jgi:hypothetical protein
VSVLHRLSAKLHLATPDSKLMASGAQPRGSIRGLRSAADADEELKAGSRALPKLEAREEVEAAREEATTAGGGSGQRREEEVARWWLG